MGSPGHGFQILFRLAVPLNFEDFFLLLYLFNTNCNFLMIITKSSSNSIASLCYVLLFELIFNLFGGMKKFFLGVEDLREYEEDWKSGA